MYNCIKLIAACFVLLGSQLKAQTPDSAQVALNEQAFLTSVKQISASAAPFIYNDFAAFNSQKPDVFARQVDSLEQVFDHHLESYNGKISPELYSTRKLENRFYFDRLFLEYPGHHLIYTGDSTKLPETINTKLAANVAEFNNPDLLANGDLLDYVMAYIKRETDVILHKNQHGFQDNLYLNIAFSLIDELFTKPEVKGFWQYQYLSKHIEDLGVKNIEGLYQKFLATATNREYGEAIRKAYESELAARNAHTIKTYKEVDGLNLDIHLFEPDSQEFKGKRPVILYLHGGSWSIGKPDWFFETGEYYAKQGYLAAAIEYRIKERHNTLPFKAVLDAKSAVRWLRENATTLGIDPDKILVTGNSAGGHMALCTALSSSYNESTDNTAISAVPNAIMVNSAAYDLTIANSRWMTVGLKDPDSIKEISPNSLISKNTPPILIIHGEFDRNTPYETALAFRDAMQKAGNKVEFHTIAGAGHYIWYGQYAGQVGKIRAEYLQKLNWLN